MPAAPAFSFVLAPIPPDPLPGGKGEIFSFLMQGASPLASPRLSRKQHGLNLRCRSPAGGLGGWGCRLTLPLALILPLSPQPPSPAGKGETFTFLMQGAPPLASPRLGGTRHLHDQRFLFVYGGQCRQPRRGGTGGEELRRLRWSSPPGQGEQVPLGFSPVGRRQRPPRLQRRSNPSDTGAPPGAGKRQMPPKFCRNRLTSTAPIWYNTNNPAGCLPPEKEHGMP